MPIRIHRSEHACALGAALSARTATGIYRTVEQAMKAMGPGFDKTYFPDQDRAKIYANRYQQYAKLGAFIEESESLN